MPAGSFGLVQLAQGCPEMGQQFLERLLSSGSCPTNQRIIPARPAFLWQNSSGDLPKPPFGTVARNGIAHLLGTGKAYARLIAPILAIAPLYHHRGRGLSPRLVQCKEIGAFAQHFNRRNRRRRIPRGKNGGHRRRQCLEPEILLGAITRSVTCGHGRVARSGFYGLPW